MITWFRAQRMHESDKLSCKLVALRLEEGQRQSLVGHKACLEQAGTYPSSRPFFLSDA